MIYLSGNLSWPVQKGRLWKPPYELFYGDKLLSANKAVSLQVDYWKYPNSFDIIGFSFDWSLYRDHAGVHISLDILGLTIHFEFYDRRHWNGEEGRWMTDYEMEHEFDKPTEGINVSSDNRDG